MYEPGKNKNNKKSQDRFNVLALSLVSVFSVYRQASLPFGC
mgnify:CR=1 FL=1